MPIASSARAKELPAAKWPWLDRIFAAWLMVMIMLCLGLLSFAAVRECRREPIRILKLEDGISDLVTEESRLQCGLAKGDAFEISIP
jgi:hypothetical protein